MKVQALQHERLFEPFIDPVDGVLCLPASSTAPEVSDRAAPHGWRFPLWIDPRRSLSENLAASEHAPASSRFGPFCDNITGMNWELPDGRLVRVGERVVKSTTGYDLLRFLLAAGNRFGKPRDLVLRLRPLCDTEGFFELDGSSDALREAASAIIRGPFLHWLESIDWIAGATTAPQLRLAVHCPAAEWPVFTEYVKGQAQNHGLQWRDSPPAPLPSEGLPDLVLKTTPDRVIPLCDSLAARGGLHCTGLLYPGVVHIHFLQEHHPAQAAENIARSVAADLASLGGDWFSHHLERPLHGTEEEAWINTLIAAWKIPT